jgi:dephospho-CoA kinase
MRVIGLTGGIASGKSLVAEFLRGMDAVVIDADRLARDVVEPGTDPYRAIVDFFGQKVVKPDGTLDRKALGGIVFADPEARKHLEKMTHPAIIKLAEKRLNEEHRKGTGVVFYMVPLLLEAGLASSVNEIWVVYTDENTQIDRLMKRDKIGRDEALRKVTAQMPMEEKIKFGQVIIDNSGTPEETRRQVMELWEKLKEEVRTEEQGASGKDA